MKKRIWLGMMSGLCLASATARADAPLPVVVAPVAVPTEDLQVDASDAGTAAVWEALQKGAISPEEAWQKGLLDAQAVQAGLNTGLAGGEDDASKRLRVSLGGLLAQHAPDVTKDALKQPKAVQLALADYYAGVGDEKAVPLYEAVLKQTKAPYEQGLVLCALGEFWSGRKQPQKAQDVFERGRQVLTGSYPHFAGEMLIRAARTWAEYENQEKVGLLYARVAKEGDGWMTGIAFWDQATTLMAQGKHQEARKLLLTPVSGQGADQIRVALLSKLSYSYYRSGEWVQARKYGREAVDQYKSLNNPLTSEGLDGEMRVAQNVLDLSEHWAKKPLTCDPQALQVMANSMETIGRHIAVHSFAAVPLQVKVDNPKVRVRIVDNEKAEDRPFFVEKEVAVDIAPEAVEDNLDAVISISSPKFPGYSVDVPLHIEVQKPAPKAPEPQK